MTTVSLSILLLFASGCHEQIQRRNMNAATARWEAKFSAYPSGRVVEIRKNDGRFQLYRHGQPFYIKGASGTAHLERFKEAGGNTIRTYTTDGLDSLLDQAARHGLAVMAGIYVGRELEGFDYRDRAAVEQQQAQVRDIVLRYKDHPALLCWAVGNEPNLAAKNNWALWPALNELVVMVQELDPNHPVTIPVYPSSISELIKNCPAIDFLSVNTFGYIVDFSNAFRMSIPYVYTEWGVQGPWEIAKTKWQAPLEESVAQKSELLRSFYAQIQRDTFNCLGSFIFYWGQKQEATPSWFSLFTESGGKTALVDVMHELWGGHPPTNYAPLLDSLSIEGRVGGDVFRPLTVGRIYSASVKGFDPEGEPLTYHWEILPDGPFFDYVPNYGRVELRPTPIPGLIVEDLGERIRFQAPSHLSTFRILVYAHDSQGNGAYANIPFITETQGISSD